MCSRYLPLNNITSLGENNTTHDGVFTGGGKTNAARAKGSSPAASGNSTAQEDLCTQYFLFAERKSTRHIVCQEQFIKLPCAVCIDRQCPHTRQDAHTRRCAKQSVGCEEYFAVISVKGGVECVCYHRYDEVVLVSR